MDEGAFVLDYFLPAGTSLATTEAFAKKIEHELKSTPEIRTFTRRTGAELGPAAATQLNRGDIMVSLVDRSSRARPSEEVIAGLRSSITNEFPEVRIEFVQVLQDVLNDLSGNPRPVEVKLFGPDYSKLHELGDSLAAQLKKVPGLVDLYDGHERDAPSLVFTMKRDDIARLNTTPEEVTRQLQTALQGTIVGSVRRFDRRVSVRARASNAVRFNAEKVLDLPFVAGDKITSFRAVTEADDGASPSLLLHEALQPIVDLTGDHEQRDLGGIADDVERIVAAFALPSGYRAVLGGQIESERATVRQLSATAGIALLLVLTVLAGQFRRLRVAALVLLTVPVAIVGALISLAATSTPLNASSLMGCVLLVGLVVKNGVLLLEEAERLAETGLDPVASVIQAGDRRVRPVLMTTLATLAGLFPLALGIGAGAELQRPLAIAVMGGLVTSTLATLGLLPPLAARAIR
jgi:multidrug efflux pump subunit AcrB